MPRPICVHTRDAVCLHLVWPFPSTWRRGPYDLLLSVRAHLLALIFMTKWLVNYKSNAVPVTDLRQCFWPSLRSHAIPTPRDRLGTASLETR